jgi:peroxiredoxin
MAIAVGDRLPDAKFAILTEDGFVHKTTNEIFAGKKIAMFAVPGAFTRTCSASHLPGFLSEADAFKAKDVDEIVCVAVNDPFVLQAWAEASGAEDKITFLSDGNAEFTKALGLEFDGSARNQGIRSRRYSMLVEDGVVKIFNLEDVPSVVEKSSAQALIGGM